MIPLAIAERCAREVCALLAPACQQITIVGSIRRMKPLVKDIEILARPKPSRPVFGEPRSAGSGLDVLVARLIDQRELARRPDPKERKDGPKHKTLWLPRSGGVPIDLFIAASGGGNWGNLVTIRTGDYLFSKALVTARSAGGLMPAGMRQEGGFLWRGATCLDCFTETSYFAALGITDIPDPATRDEAMAHRLRAAMTKRVRGEGRS